MQALTELLPPSAVTHAVKLSFLSPRAQNLVVAKSSLLQIYEWTTVLSRIRDTANHNSPPRDSHNASSSLVDASTSQQQYKLLLVAEYPLSGTITSLASVKASSTKSGGEALLISFKDAKISLVEWDPEAYGLSTISIHYYESEDLQGSSWAPDLQHCSSFLTADPSSRCAALKFGVRHLAVLPFRQLEDDLTGDYDPELDVTPQPQKSATMTNGGPEEKQTPYSSSFVLPLTALDPNLIHAVDLAFLYEYREPTLGVLSSSKSASTSLAQERKDVLAYSAFTLDLEQRARTLLLSVSGLPSDLFKLAPLPLPVGGTLLIGGNEVVHIDQSGKTNAVAVNEFARQASAFPMTDQSDLGLRLEGCVVEQLNSSNGDLVLILSTGELVVVSFRVDGRSVSGLSLRPVPKSHGGTTIGSAASCAVALAHDVVFVGSEDGDSILLRCNRQRTQLSRKRSHADMLGVEDVDSDADVDDEDDLYAEDAVTQRPRQSSNSLGSTEDVVFQIDDRLPNFTTNGEPCFSSTKEKLSTFGSLAGSEPASCLRIALATGRGASGGLAFLQRQIDWSLVDELTLSDSSMTWSLATDCSKAGTKNNGQVSNGSSHQDYDRFIIGSTGSGDPDSSSKIYEWSSGRLEEKSGTDLDSDTATINAGVLCAGKRIVQVSQSEVRCLDQDLALVQIFPMLDEDTDTDLVITHTSFMDPYLLIFRNDLSVMVLMADAKGDQLEELDKAAIISGNKWTAGCLYTPKSSQSNPLACLLGPDGILNIFELPNLDQPMYVVGGINSIPATLSPENMSRRSPNRESIAELLIADIGDSVSQSPFLILRTSENGLVLYNAYHFPSEAPNGSFTENLRWLKVADTSLIKPHEDDDASIGDEKGSLKYIPNLGGYSTVFVGGKDPSLILKDAKSMPKVFPIGDRNIRDLSPVHVASCEHGLVATSSKVNASLVHLPTDTSFGTGMAISRTHVGQQVDAICYHEYSDLYVIGTNEPVDFKLPADDDWHQEWAKEDISPRPTGELAKVHVFDPKSRRIISETTLEQDEIITTVKMLDLEISEITHDRNLLVAVSTAIIKGEDLSSNGSIYVFDIVHVVPEPERPETDRSLKQIVREEVKGAVTALSEIGTEGFLLAAQGQKCMVRGLKEDNSLLPVAFLDVQCHVTVAKNVKGTGLALIGDAIKGIWLFGYSSDPYRMRLFSKTRSTMEVVTAEFLPCGKQLFIIAADSDCNVHVFEFNPEDPKSLSGQRLLNRSIFHSGHFPTSMSLIPDFSDDSPTIKAGTDVDMDELESNAQGILLTTQSGAISIITPLHEESYRRLGALQAHLTGLLEHTCGLNPRAFRAVESEGFGSRGILDGQILKRWHMLSTQRKAEACARVGSDVWEINADLRSIYGVSRL